MVCEGNNVAKVLSFMLPLCGSANPIIRLFQKYINLIVQEQKVQNNGLAHIYTNCHCPFKNPHYVLESHTRQGLQVSLYLRFIRWEVLDIVTGSFAKRVLSRDVYGTVTVNEGF